MKNNSNLPQNQKEVPTTQNWLCSQAPAVHGAGEHQAAVQQLGHLLFPSPQGEENFCGTPPKGVKPPNFSDAQ